MHSGNHLNVSAGTAASKWGANSAQHRLIDENETSLFGLSRLDQSFLKRAEVVAAISRAQAAHQDWALLRSSDNATVFLLHSAKLLPAVPIRKVVRS
jgi:hypothetical protein